VSEQSTDVPADHPDEERGGARPSTPSGASGPSPRRVLVIGTLVALLLAVGAGALVAMSLSDDDPEQLGDGPAQADLVPIDEGEIIGLPIAEPYMNFDGSEANTAGYLGTPLVINFFAEWCPPCVAEMPAFEAVHQERQDEVAFLGISTQESTEDAQAIIDSTGITYDVGRDPDGEMFATFGGTAMPTTALVDENGTVVDVHSGALTADELREWLDESFGTS
jgi:cytochrome c biogenesis protein CcmG, thiol:disulfide interchange protein DsbE